MVNIYNTSINQRAIERFNVRDGQFFDNNIGNKVMPIVNIDQPTCDVVANGNNTATGAGTIYTTPTGKDFYLTGYQVSVASNATCDGDNAYLTFYVNGVVRYIVFALIVGVANNVNVTQDFTTPIKIDRGTAIQMTSTFSAGAQRKCASLFGYLSDSLTYNS